MEWCCAKCGLAATADDWSLLSSMGWRITAGGEPRCVLCLKRESEDLRSAPAIVPQAPTPDQRRVEP